MGSLTDILQLWLAGSMPSMPSIASIVSVDANVACDDDDDEGEGQKMRLICSRGRMVMFGARQMFAGE